MRPFWRRLPAVPPPPPRPLGVCARCRADMVVPVRWHEHGEDAWWMALRCGECGTREEVVVPNREAERFGSRLDAAGAQIAAAAERIDRERLCDMAAAFAMALEYDLIDAGDFRQR